MKRGRKKCHIYLFRHGGTVYNENRIFTGWHNSSLTKVGKKNSEKVAKLLKNKSIDAAFHSHLPRSVETLKIILKYHPECKQTIQDDRIIERHYGDLEQHHHKAVIKKFGLAKFNKWHRSYTGVPPHGESIKRVELRVKSFIKFLLKKIRSEKINVAISAHGNSMRPFRRYFEHFSIKKMIALENPWDDYFDYVVEC